MFQARVDWFQMLWNEHEPHTFFNITVYTMPFWNKPFLYISSDSNVSDIFIQHLVFSWYTDVSDIDGNLLLISSTTYQSGSGEAYPPPPVWNVFKGLIWKFWLQNTHRLCCNQHAMFTLCILFSSITNKS